MNFRKFYFIICCIVSVFLFITGAFLLSQRGTSSESINILVLCTDEVGANTDTMMVVNYNPVTAMMNLLSIPRDTKVTLNGSTSKINAAYSHGGANVAVDSVSKLLDTKIKYYVILNISVFKEIIALLGGVDYYIPVDMNYDDPLQNLHILLKKGQQHLDGQKAEQFIRFRQPSHYTDEIMKYYDGSDLKRINAQQSFVKEVIRQKLNLKSITKINNVIQTVFKNVETDIPMSDALKMAQSAGKIKPDELNMFMLPGHAEDGGAWYYVPDKNKISELVKQYFSASSGFVSNKNAGKANSGSTDDSATEKFGTEPPDVEKNSDLIQNNPSNSETGFKDIGIEVP